MDMSAYLGGFSAALVKYPLWVKNGTRSYYDTKMIEKGRRNVSNFHFICVQKVQQELFCHYC